MAVADDLPFHNMRELKYCEEGGPCLRPGRLYRSALPLMFSEQEVSRTLRDLGIKAIIDLRNKYEKERHFYSTSLRNQFDIIEAPIEVFTSVQYPGHSRETYSDAIMDILYKNQGSVKIFFEVLSKTKSYPLLAHCHGGKDRSGVLIALLLELLGFSWNTIIDDYTRSPGVTRQNLVPLWDEIESLGRTEQYLIHEIGLNLQDIEKIREINLM